MNLKARRLLAVILALAVIITSSRAPYPSFAADKGKVQTEQSVSQDVQDKKDEQYEDTAVLQAADKAADQVGVRKKDEKENSKESDQQKNQTKDIKEENNTTSHAEGSGLERSSSQITVQKPEDSTEYLLDEKPQESMNSDVREKTEQVNASAVDRTERISGQSGTEKAEGSTGQSESENSKKDNVQSGSEKTAGNTGHSAPGKKEESIEQITDEKSEETTSRKQNDLTPADVLQQAEDQGIHLMEMKEGETITFKAMAGTTEKKVTVTRGTHYKYSTYGLGDYETYKYHVSFGNVSATAYCIQPSKSSPDSGTYTITKLSDSKKLAKVCYYGTKAAGEESFFSEQHSGFSEGKRFILVHLAASYANSGSDAFSGANSTAKSLAKELYNWCVAQPEIPDVDMSFSDDDVTAFAEGNRQRTKEIQFKADELQTITFHLPEGVKLHNVSSGKTSAAGAEVEISGGTSFYLSAPLSQAAEVSSSWSTTMKGSIVKDFSAYKISTGGGEQDLALVFGEGVDDEKYIDFHVSWIRLGELTIYKEGEELSSVTKDSEGVTFHYSRDRQKNAVYNVYAGENIKDGSGEVIHKKGKLIAGNLKTDAEGSVTLENLYAGKYTVTEVTAPSGFYNKQESKDVTVGYTSSDNVKKITFVNDRQKAEITTVKQDSETHQPLAGGVFGLYAGNDIKNESGKVILEKDTLIEKAVTKGNGISGFQADIPLGYSYYIKELKAPVNYYRNQADTYSFRFTYTDDQQAKQSFQHIFSNVRTKAEITLIKKDRETGGQPQGDAVLSGAVYGLYAREDIVHPDGKTGIMYKAGQKIASLNTDNSGKARINDLYLGKYYIKEISPSTGYLIDEKEYDILTDYLGDLIPTVKKEVSSLETVKKQPFQVIKAADNDKTDADLLKGAGFTAYLISSLKKKSDGTYDYGSAKPVVLTQQGGTKMITDQTGHAVSIPLPYGTYIVLETDTPHNYKPVQPFIVRINDNNPTVPQTWRVLLDDAFSAKLKIIKQDDETGRPVLLPDTEFKIYDMDQHTYVEQVTTYPSTKIHSSYFTNDEGYLILPQNLQIGRYRIEEVHSPEGYSLNKDYVEVMVDTDTMYHIDDVSGDAIIEAVYENHPVKGRLTIEKSGEKLYDFDGKQFIYKEKPLSEAVFEIYAAEDIYTPDHHRDVNGDRLIAVSKDSLVGSAVTDENGEAVMDDLPLGTYYVKEKTAPEGYRINLEMQEAEFVYAGQDIPVIEQEMDFHNERQNVEVTVRKCDILTGQCLQGAEFGIYNKEEIVSPKTLIEPDTLLESFVSDTEGRAVCTLDLPLGQYYVKELKAPPGYLRSDEIIELDASYQGQDIETVVLESEIKNESTEVDFTKSDITTGMELSGAKLSVLDKDGNLIESWISEKDHPHIIRALHADETYILREEIAPYGYLKATEIEFTVSESSEPQKVDMKDDVPTGMLIINKKGEFLEKVSLLDNVKGIVEHLFEYLSGSLTDVKFELYAAEDIKAADGVSTDHYKMDQLVTEMITDETGYAFVKDLPLGKYYVKETGTAYGHILDSERHEVDLTYRDQDTPVVVYDEEWQNNRQKVKVNLLKTDRNTGKGLEGGIFGMFAKEPVYSSKGTMLLEEDEIIELKKTDKEGRITFMADLPMDASYYIREIYPPDGYTTSNEKQEFETEYQGAQLKEQTYSFTFVDEPTTVEVTKSDLTNGQELPGAHLKVTDPDGKTVDSWISTDRPHIIQKLVVDKTYTLTETKPADGYVTAESVRFIIKNTAEIQKIEMKDDVTKVKLSKQDIAGKELPGARLTIYDDKGKELYQWVSTTKPHYIEMLPVGHYVLREQTAPKGYLVSEDVKFEVKDTAKIQFVKMKDKPEKSSKKSHGAKTGDTVPAQLWILVLLLGISGLLFYVRIKWRGSKD